MLDGKSRKSFKSYRSSPAVNSLSTLTSDLVMIKLSLCFFLIGLLSEEM